MPGYLEDFWGPVITVIRDMGYPVPPDTTAYLAVGRVTDDKCVGPEESGILFIAWRCLYAATVHARVENKEIRLDVALRRCMKDTVRRLTSYGEAWMRWSATRIAFSAAIFASPLILEYANDAS